MSIFEYNPSNELDFNTANPVPSFAGDNVVNIVYTVVYEEEHLGFSGYDVSWSGCQGQIPRSYQLGSYQAEFGNMNPVA